jgi:formylglycine-generating enzyme
LGRRDRVLQLAQRAYRQALSPADGGGWEKAARGTDQRRYPWGSAIDRSYANFVGAQSFDTVLRVGYYDATVRGDLQTRSNASPYGAYDMAGNVMEWCQDWYSRDYYAVSPRKNPKGPETGAYRVLRGGSFFVEAHDLRTYGRSPAWPSFQGYRRVGFRAVREPCRRIRRRARSICNAIQV